ncbi:YcjF family protein [Aurantimonas sp. VKM B-3413]|uniref:YcjF family protein n=1 Tax=Aurantimonas sp. VKM B-3413 TaxID=2779401 RepID=UPI001E51317D|nr:TIGR01620 family protein [Aurantimonas sp. VKM B-3413]MCB8837224.1 TIGR01620 family protein [Aurantimonas sp. VKM B-3413]
MSDDPNRPRRRPGAYRLPGAEREAEEQRAAPEVAQRPPRAFEDLARLEIDPDEAVDQDVLEGLEVEPASPIRRGFSFGKLFVTAFGILVSFAVGLAVDDIVRQLFERNEWLGWTALAVAALFVIGAIGVAAREAIGLMRLGAIDRERQKGLAAYQSDSLPEARSAVAALTTLISGRPQTAEGRARLAAVADDVIDPADLVALAERELLVPLDIEARALVLASAKRVSVVTAVSPKALVDVSYVLFETVKLIRRMSELYGARPGTLGLIRLTRNVVAHLAVTGSIAIGDGVVQQLLGHGVAARLSSRLGEGVVNGLLTARVGLAAMDLCRPLPFLRERRPTISDMLGELSVIGGSNSLAERAMRRRDTSA